MYDTALIDAYENAVINTYEIDLAEIESVAALLFPAWVRSLCGAIAAFFTWLGQQ